LGSDGSTGGGCALEGWSLTVGLAVEVAAGVAAGVALSAATPGRDGDSLAGLCALAEPCESLAELDETAGLSLEEVAAGAAPCVGAFELLVLAALFDGAFALAGAASCGRDTLGALTCLSSVVAMATFSAGLVTATFADGGAIGSVLTVDGAVATCAGLPGVDVTWSSTSAAPTTPTTIVPKAMEK
jgi:hypothetical protein